MPTIRPVTETNTPADALPLLEAVKKKMGMVPNLLSTLANAPSALQSYLSLSESVAGGNLGAPERELVALAVAERNACDYCVAAHSTIGRSVGLSGEQIASARRGTSEDARNAALLTFTGQVVESRGHVGADGLAAFKDAGWTDSDALEVVANVALHTLTNYTNRLANTEIDFPAPPALVGQAP